MFNINAMHGRLVFAASRTNAAASVAIPGQLAEDAHVHVFQLNLNRIPKSQIQVGMVCITPFELPDGGPLTFSAFAAAPSHLLWRVESITSPQSMTIRFLAATHQPDFAEIVAVLGIDNPTVTVNKPSHLLVPVGDLLHALQPAIAAAEGAIAPPHPAHAADGGAPPGAIAAAIAPPHPAQAGYALPAHDALALHVAANAVAAASVRQQDSLDFANVDRTKGLYSTVQHYFDMFFFKGAEGMAVVSAKQFSWSVAKDRFVTITTGDNRLIDPDIIIHLTDSTLKHFLTWDFREGRCSIMSFASQRYPITDTPDLLTALEQLARIAQRGMGPDLEAAILHLRTTFLEYLHTNASSLPLHLGAALIDEKLDHLRTSPLSDPNVAHQTPLCERLKTIICFDPKAPTAVSALNHRDYLTVLMSHVAISPASHGYVATSSGGQSGYTGGGTSGYRGRGTNSSRGRGRGRGRGGGGGGGGGSGGGASSNRHQDWWNRAPPSIKSMHKSDQFCFDWYLNQGPCASGHGASRKSNTACHASPTRKHCLPLGEFNHSDIHAWLLQSPTPKY